jgi:hypothetical protein
MNMQSMHTGAMARDFGAAALLGAREPLPISQVVLHHLRTPGEIAEILHLREEIDLSVHTAAGRAFELLEKKETSAGLSSVSSSVASGSGPSASSRSATN